MHQSNLPEGAKPVRPGWQFSFVAVVPTEASSWVYTLDVERIPSHQTPGEVLAAQLTALTGLLTQRPLLLGDGGDGNVAFVRHTHALPCDCLLRLAKNRVLYRPPPHGLRSRDRGVPRQTARSFAVTTRLPMAPPRCALGRPRCPRPAPGSGSLGRPAFPGGAPARGVAAARDPPWRGGA